VGLLAGAPAAEAAPSGPIHPGVQTLTSGGQCTSNFIFRDAADMYIGQAAHCSGTGAQTDTNGCASGSLPLDTPVTVTGASRPGTLVYNSWLAMQAAHEADADALRLQRPRAREARSGRRGQRRFVGARLRRADGRRRRQHGGGDGLLIWQLVASCGDRAAQPEAGPRRPGRGGGWSRSVYTVTPGIPGDSGSGFMNATGQAIGVLSTLAVLPLPLSNGVGDLSRELAYARANGFADLALVKGTQPFKGDLLGAILGAGSSLGRR
jgi:hypothetical protein